MADRGQFDELRKFLPIDGPTVWFRWPGQLVALLCVVVVAVAGIHPTADDAATDHGAVLDGAEAAAQMADAVAAAFADSPFITDPTRTVPTWRSGGLPEDPIVGLTTDTPAGPVQLVLPGGLGKGQRTAHGMVYPDAGVGFDFLAENTASGKRTVARIVAATGPRVVTTYVRTPVDTVMLAHTNGYLTLNRATPAAETIGMFSPAETRDANGRLVPSSYVVRQVRPQLYQLSEVIDPQPGTAWPVYVDPPLHVAGVPLPEFSFSDVADAVAGAAGAVANAASSAANAAYSGVNAAGNFVKSNPLESAMLVGGVALAVTGVGGPAGAAMIAGAAVNVASAGVDVAAAVMPDNRMLGMASDALAAASMLTPQGAAKKVVREGVEAAAGAVAKQLDEVVDVAKVAPTPPAQLADDVAAAAVNPPRPGGGSSIIPNAPPGGQALPAGGKDFTQAQKARGVADALGVPPTTRGAELDRLAGETGVNLQCANCNSRVFLQEGPTRAGDKVPPNRAHFDHYPIPKSQGGTGGNSSRNNILCQGCNLGKGDVSAERWDVIRSDVADSSRADIRAYEGVYGRRPDGVIRSPNERVDTPGRKARWERYQVERDAERAGMGQNSGSRSVTSRQGSGPAKRASDSGKRTSSKKSARESKLKKGGKKKKKKKKSTHKKKQQRQNRGS